MLAAGALALAALSLLAPSQPTYDPWSWLLWGREVAALDLSTLEGPAFKPLPVAIAALLSPFGDAAPQMWLVVARAGALCAVALGARVAWTLAGGSRVAAVAGGAAVALTAGFAWHASTGGAELLFVAFALGAIDRGLAGRHGTALALGVLAGLLRPESWLFLGVYGLWLWRAAPELRPWLLAAPPALLALWFGPELWGSGDLLRSQERARIPNPGQPATAARPALASLEAAARLPLWPLLAGALLLRGRALALAGAGVAWILLVALMAERGYSGEPRYALPGVIVVGVAAAVGWGRARPAQVAVLAAVLAPFAVARIDGLAGELRRAADEARLYGSLSAAVDAAGGRDAVLACGRPVAGRLRGPALAYALDVHKEVVDFDPTAGGGVIFHSRIRSGASVMPPVDRSARLIARSARWAVSSRACESRLP